MIFNYRTAPGAICDSDPNLSTAKLRIKLKTIIKTEKKKQCISIPKVCRKNVVERLNENKLLERIIAKNEVNKTWRLLRDGLKSEIKYVLKVQHNKRNMNLRKRSH